jgi:hypothetical protein
VPLDRVTTAGIEGTADQWGFKMVVNRRAGAAAANAIASGSLRAAPLAQLSQLGKKS